MCGVRCLLCSLLLVLFLALTLGKRFGLGLLRLALRRSGRLHVGLLRLGLLQFRELLLGC